VLRGGLLCQTELSAPPAVTRDLGRGTKGVKLGLQFAHALAEGGVKGCTRGRHDERAVEGCSGL